MPLDHHVAESLFGAADLDDYFGDHDVAVVPWPRATRQRDRALVSSVDLDALLSGPPHLVDLDPRWLYATQPSVVAQHARYYTTDEWERSGITSADRHQVANRYPLVHRDRRGRSLLLAGHHRALVALIHGRPVRTRILRAGPGATGVLPRLLVGNWCSIRGVCRTTNSRVAAEEIESGHTVLVPDVDVAVDTMAQLGLGDSTIADRLRVAAIPVGVAA